MTDDQRFFQENVRRFVETEMPVGRVRELAETDDAFDREWWRSAAGLGFTSLLVPESHGGGTVSDNALSDLAVLAEECGRTIAPGPLLPTNLVADTIAHSGTDDQRDALLPGIVEGVVVASWCFKTATCRRFNDVGLAASAVNGGFTLSGEAVSVEAAGQADHFLVTAMTSDGPTQFLVAADAVGVTVAPQTGLDLARRHGAVNFDGVEVGPSSVVGSPGDAAADVERQFHLVCLLQCAEMAGAAARVLEFTAEYAFDRYSFGRPLASYQALKHRFADMKLWLESSHAVTDGLAEAMQKGDEATKLASVAKAFVGERCVEIVQDCVQMHGGIGVTWEHDLHLYLRRVTVDRGLFGTPDDHRDLVAADVGL